jgi:3-keto steroid reductase
MPYLNSVICNAGIGGWTGINWPLAIWTVLTDLVQSVTWPPFKMSVRGLVTPKQLPKHISKNEKIASENATESNGLLSASHDENEEDEPPLGEVFTANLFGHYMLSHWLMPLLSSPNLPSAHSGRVIFITSIEGMSHHLSLSDPQCLYSTESYESSKRMTDVMVLTSRLPSTQLWVERFLAPAPLDSTHYSNVQEPPQPPKVPKLYVSQPGICATSIVPLPFILNLAMIAAMYLARFLGSPWHPTSPYKGATAPVWLALSPQETLDAFETPPHHPTTPSTKHSKLQDGINMNDHAGPGVRATRPIKWGSSTDYFGHESVRPTEVERWGFMGLASDDVERRKGRKRGAKAATAEERETFEEVGRGVWKYLEELRGEWEGRLEGVED